MNANSFRDYVMDQLEGVGAVHCRSMFGGHGVYLDDTFFAIIYQGRLYFKTCDRTRDAYVRAGSEPFRPSATQTLGSYYEVPGTVLEDVATLKEWATQAASVV